MIIGAEPHLWLTDERYIFTQGYSLYFFLILLIYGGFRVGVLGLGFWIRFLGVGIYVDGVCGLWCGAFWVFFGVGALYINTEESIWEKNSADETDAF